MKSLISSLHGANMKIIGLRYTKMLKTGAIEVGVTFPSLIVQ
jgi:hypothetical protein